ncbi:tubulin polyglutamylase TTLL1, partial [Kipferlia bialata]
AVWIVKPTNRAQGKGIQIVSKLAQIKRFSHGRGVSSRSDQYIITRYIDRPMLIGGKKFDLRLYVLVVSFRPLKCYIYQNGFCRLCSVPY